MSALARELAKLVEDHGARAVLATLFAACHVAADRASEIGTSGETKSKRWRLAADAFGLALADVAIAERLEVIAPRAGEVVWSVGAPASTRVDVESETHDPAMTLAGALRVLAK
jgi:hypothetical protein